MGTTQAGPPGVGRPSHVRPGPRRVLVVVAVLVALAAVAVVAVALGLRLPSGPAGPTVTPTPVVLATPTPTVPAAERDRTTAFQQALPDTVLAFAVTGQAEAVDLLDLGAVEAWDLAYTDGTQVVTLRAAQWPTVEGATGVMTGLVSVPPADGSTPAPALREEPVLVGGAEVGRLVVVGDDDEAQAFWTNGTTLFRLQGPTAAVLAFYDAFGM